MQKRGSSKKFFKIFFNLAKKAGPVIIRVVVTESAEKKYDKRIKTNKSLPKTCITCINLKRNHQKVAFVFRRGWLCWPVESMKCSRKSLLIIKSDKIEMSHKLCNLQHPCSQKKVRVNLGGWKCMAGIVSVFVFSVCCMV